MSEPREGRGQGQADGGAGRGAGAAGTVRSHGLRAFVDLGGVDGLLHVSEISFRQAQAQRVREDRRRHRCKNPADRPREQETQSVIEERGVDPWSTPRQNTPSDPITGRVTKLGSSARSRSGRRHRRPAANSEISAADQAPQRRGPRGRHRAAGRAQRRHRGPQDELQPQAGRARSVEDGQREIRDRYGHHRHGDARSISAASSSPG